MFFMEVQTHPLGWLRTHFQVPIPPNNENPITFSHQLPFLALFSTLVPISRARSTIRQHMLTKILESVNHVIKYWILKYYHPATRGRVNFRPSKPLLPLLSQAFFDNFEIQILKSKHTLLQLFVFGLVRNCILCDVKFSTRTTWYGYMTFVLFRRVPT